jgi:hypothetical protein
MCLYFSTNNDMAKQSSLFNNDDDILWFDTPGSLTGLISIGNMNSTPGVLRVVVTGNVDIY